MTALAIQDPLIIYENGTYVGYAEGLNFQGVGVTLQVSGSNVNVVGLNESQAFNIIPVWNEIPSGSIDGMNMVYTLQATPIDKKLMLFHNGILLEEGLTSDYVLNNNIISLLSSPLIGDKLNASYLKRTNINYVWNEIPVGDINEINKDFYLSHIPNSNTLMLFYNGRLIFPNGDDYTLTGNHIELISDFTTKYNDKICAYYEYTTI